MQGDESTIPMKEEPTQQKAGGTEHNESSNTVDFEKISNYFFYSRTRLLITLISILFILPFIFGHFTMWMYNNNSTLAGMHTTTATNLIIAVVTFLYVLLTGALVTQSKEAVAKANVAIEKSEEAIAQSKKEQQIRDIEHRLEKFYIPADDILNGKDKKGRNNTIEGNLEAKYKGLKQIRKYSYLAETATYEAYEKYIKSNCDYPKLTTCKDKFSTFNYRECESYTKDRDNCFYNYTKCSANLEIL